MEDELCGQNAIMTLNSRLIHGKCIEVKPSERQSDGASVPSTRIKVRNIPYSLSARDLRSLFSPYGVILSVEITNDEGLVVSK